MQTFFTKRLKAISLIEVSIGLVVIGLLVFGALKGWRWVETAKVNNTISQIVQIQAANQSYMQTNHKRPSIQDYWKALKAYGGPDYNEDGLAISNLGATFKPTENEVLLGPITAPQAFSIKNSLDQNLDLSKGWIKIQDLSGQDQTSIDIADKTANYQLSMHI